MLLALAIFGLYHDDVVGKQSEEVKYTLPHEEAPQNEVPLYEGVLEVYNTNFDEMNKTTEEEEEKVFSVEISGELNTTKETEILLKAVVKHAKNLQACNYFWYENNVTIGIGESLEMAFDKGEHIITVRALESNGDATYTTVTIRAYDYYMVIREHYNAYYGNLEYSEKEIQNHKGRYLLMDDGTFVKDSYLYDDEYRMIENKYEYYNYPTENKTVRYEYDEQGNRTKETTLNSEGEVIYVVVSIYEDGNLTSSISGVDEDSLSSENYKERYNYYYPVYTEESGNGVENNEDKKEYNDNGKVTYEEVNYGHMKLIHEYSYDENDKLVKEISSMQSERRFNARTSYYDDKSHVTSFERKYGDENGVRCHYKTLYTYNSEGNTKSRVDQLLEGDCPYMSEVKKNYNYDKNGNIKSIDATLDGEQGYTTLKVIKSYTNELDL